jgi:transcriptional regulator with XRE-family HTH domain
VTSPIARHLRALRTHRGLTQTEVAHRMNTVPRTVSRLESGQYNPRWEMLLRYCNAVGAKVTIRLEEPQS